MQNFTLLILSAGLGTRMKNLTKTIPKPLLKIHNTTLINNTINFFEKVGCNKFIINTHYLYKQMNDYLDLNFSDKKIISIYEPEILDTGGGIKNAIEFFDNSLVVLSTSAKNIKNLSKEFIDNLNKETIDKLAQKDISDHDRYILNHKLDVLKEIRQ